MPELKQIQDLGDLLRHVITDIEIGSETIVFKRSDNLEYTYEITEPEDGDPGENTTGIKGDQGESAYEAAVRLGLAEDLRSWLNSFKGDPGNDGRSGSNGRSGNDGRSGNIYPITLKDLQWLDHGTDPIFTIEKNGDQYEMSLGIPLNITGDPGKDAIKPEIEIGSVILSELDEVEAQGHMEENNGKYTLYLTIPKGVEGERRPTLKGDDGWGPKIVIKTEYIAYGSPIEVIKEDPGEIKAGEPWTQSFVVRIPRGAPATKGPMGPQGNKSTEGGMSIFKLINQPEYIEDPGKGFSCWTGDIFGDQRTTAFGYCWRTDVTFQTCMVFGDEEREGWYYRMGPGEGKITTAWTKRTGE